MGNPSTEFDLLGDFLGILFDDASRLEKVKMSKWLFAASLPLFASKTDMGVALDSSSVFSPMGDKMLEVKISFGYMFVVIGVFLRFLNSS